MSTPRRKYTPEFKLETVRLVTDQGQTVAQVARQLDIHAGLLHQWRAAVKKNGALAFTAKSQDKLESEEVRKLRRELNIAREERDLPKKPSATSRSQRNEVPVDPRASRRVSVRHHVPRSRSHSRWIPCVAVSRKGPRCLDEAVVREAAASLFVNSNQTYGHRRICAGLAVPGMLCGPKRVARLMKKLGMQVKTKRKFRLTTDSRHDFPIADNLLDRQFDQEMPNTAWISDIIYIQTDALVARLPISN